MIESVTFCHLGAGRRRVDIRECAIIGHNLEFREPLFRQRDTENLEDEIEHDHPTTDAVPDSACIRSAARLLRCCRPRRKRFASKAHRPYADRNWMNSSISTISDGCLVIWKERAFALGGLACGIGRSDCRAPFPRSADMALKESQH